MNEKPVTMISAKDLSLAMADGDIFLLDVREDNEVANASIKGATHIAMNDIGDKLETLPKDKTIYVFCHHGTRSMMVCQYLQQQGFDCKNLEGGIHRYALEIDKTIPIY
ncbi:MAG: rhodanese-like domain-containing protein [Alphaproteobacteria bacterium]